RVCQRHADVSPLGRVLTLSLPARRELLALLDQVAGIDLGKTDGELAFRAWRAAGDKLRAWAQKYGRDRSLADAFVLNRRAWRAELERLLVDGGRRKHRTEESPEASARRYLARLGK